VWHDSLFALNTVNKTHCSSEIKSDVFSHAFEEYTSLQQCGGTGRTSAKTATTEIATEMGAEPKFKTSFTKRKIKDTV